MSSKDRLAVKKQISLQVSNADNARNNSHSNYLNNRQYLALQTTYEIDEDGNPVDPHLFTIAIPANYDIASCYLCTEFKSPPNLWSVPYAPIKYNKLHTNTSFMLAPRRFIPFVTYT